MRKNSVTKAYQWRGSTGPKHKKLFILFKRKELEKNVLYSKVASMYHAGDSITLLSQLFLVSPPK